MPHVVLLFMQMTVLPLVYLNVNLGYTLFQQAIVTKQHRLFLSLKFHEPVVSSHLSDIELKYIHNS